MFADPGIRIHSAAPHNLDPFSLLQAVKLARPKLDEEVVIAIKACADSRGKRERGSVQRTLKKVKITGMAAAPAKTKI